MKLFKSKQEFAIGIETDYPKIWVCLMHRDTLFGFLPLNDWASYSLPSNDLEFLKNYLTTDEIRNLKKIIVK